MVINTIVYTIGSLVGLFVLTCIICLILDIEIEDIPDHLKQAFKSVMKRLKKIFTNLKQHKMNYKSLGRAMGFMFLPTLGVLTVLLVGFFDPVAMWTFIKSNDGWAVFTRVVLLVAEVTLIVVMYFVYNKEDLIKKSLNTTESEGVVSCKVDPRAYICNIFNGSSDDEYVTYFTKNRNIIVVERKPKSKS